MEFSKVIPLILTLLSTAAAQGVVCNASGVNQTSCSNLSPNGCCAKGCMRNAVGHCVRELCTFTWNGWLKHPVTMSCYFHWFLLIFAMFIFTLMLLLLVCNVTHEVCLCLRRRQQTQYVRFTPTSSPSVSVV